MFKFIADNHDTFKTNFITWVGDNSAHNVWDNTDQEVYDYTARLTGFMKEAFGSLDIDFYPSMGNHDTWPVNIQNFDAPNTNFQINKLKTDWTDKNWLSQEEADLFAKWGYYSKPLKSNPKGRVISLNTNVADNLNWWLWKDRSDPGNHIQWLENELKQIEAEGGFTYIIGHIPSRSFLHQFGSRYKALMERYQHIIRFSSFGHTH